MKHVEELNEARRDSAVVYVKFLDLSRFVGSLIFKGFLLSVPRWKANIQKTIECFDQTSLGFINKSKHWVAAFNKDTLNDDFIMK